MRDEDLHSKLYLNKDHWYHFVALYDGDYHRLYVNGVLQENKQSTVHTSPTQPIYIGAKNLDETDFFFTGALDDARMYNRVLTEADALQQYGGDWTRVYQPAPCAVVLPTTEPPPTLEEIRRRSERSGPQ